MYIFYFHRYINLNELLTFIAVLSSLQIPATIADNGGYDSAQLISELRAIHTEGKHTFGLSEYI